MQQFTFPDLQRTLSSCAGIDEAVNLDGPVLDTEFTELGYDSLAVLELANRVQREYRVPMPDDAPQHMITPRSTISYINTQLAAATGLLLDEAV
ncbi:MAG: acyl carrier protein [Pseudonocardiaceae bacterium]